MSDQAAGARPGDKWIPWLFVLFFVVLAVLDGIFVTIALKTHTGTVTDSAYERGVAYNQTLVAASARDALGWQAAISLQDGNRISVTLLDEGALPLDGAAVVAKVMRPVQDGYDFELKLAGEGSGVYSAPADFPLPGQWSIRIFATWQDRHYQSSKTLVIR